MKEFRLRFPVEQIPFYAARYNIQSDEKVEAAAKAGLGRGYLQKSELIDICRWKSPRRVQLVCACPEEDVKEITCISFGATTERVRIGILTLLPGVGWPTASAILNLTFPERYPLLDFRALWSLSVTPPSEYDFEFWSAYCAATRGIAAQAGLDMRSVDRALWQFSKEHQPNGIETASSDCTTL